MKLIKKRRLNLQRKRHPDKLRHRELARQCGAPGADGHEADTKTEKRCVEEMAAAMDKLDADLEAFPARLASLSPKSVERI